MRAAFLSIVGMASATLVSACATAEHMPRPARSTYVYCNVYTTIACFGVAQGDRLQMTIPADFVHYELELGAGLRASVYVGYSPRPSSPDLVELFVRCSKTAKPCARIVNGRATLEALYWEDGEAVHLTLLGLNDQNRNVAREFVDNFRRCSLRDHNPQCTDRPLFEALRQQ